MLQQLKLAIIRAISHAKYEIQYSKTLRETGMRHTTEIRYIIHRATGKRMPVIVHKNTNVIK